MSPKLPDHLLTIFLDGLRSHTDAHSNITFVNVSSVENHGSGFSIWVKNLQDNHLPISITMRNCSNLRDHISGINIGSVANPGRENARRTNF